MDWMGAMFAGGGGGGLGKFLPAAKTFPLFKSAKFHSQQLTMTWFKCPIYKLIRESNESSQQLSVLTINYRKKIIVS